MSSADWKACVGHARKERDIGFARLLEHELAQGHGAAFDRLR
jgi:hypothetical protein